MVSKPSGRAVPQIAARRPSKRNAEQALDTHRTLTARGLPLLPLVAAVAMLFVVACYASLLPLGKWHPDEFSQFSVIRLDGWHAVAHRIFGWSPRPVSELVLWAYAQVVIQTGRPHTALFLGGLWAVVLLGFYGAARRTRRYPALIATSLVASFLVLEKPGEMFYWPAAAAAYLLGLGALGIASLLVAERRPNPVLLGGALVGAAWCSEIGAMAVLFYVALLLAAGRFARGPAPIPRIVWAAAAASAFVFVVTAINRASSSTDVMLPNSSTVGSFSLSLEAALPAELHELLTARLGAGAWGLPLGLAAKLLLFAGFRPIDGDEAPDSHMRLRSVLLGIALLLTSYFSIVLAFDKFGAECCERHETVRAALVVLALYGFAQAWPAQRPGRWRTAALALPILATFLWRTPDLLYDRGLIRVTVSNRAALWSSGEQPDGPVEWRNDPIPRIADGNWFLVPGTYRISGAGHGDLEWKSLGILAFFGKHVLIVRPP